MFSARSLSESHDTQHLEDINGCTLIHDDIAVWVRTIYEHDCQLKAACEHLQNMGLGLNIDKCVFRQSEMPYIGDLITYDGVKHDPEKVQAIMDMPTLRNVTELQRALGLATYLGKFIPSLSARTAVLRTLIAQDTDWQWQPEHESAWLDLEDFHEWASPTIFQWEERSQTFQWCFEGWARSCPPTRSRWQVDASCVRIQGMHSAVRKLCTDRERYARSHLCVWEVSLLRVQ